MYDAIKATGDSYANLPVAFVLYYVQYHHWSCTVMQSPDVELRE